MLLVIKRLWPELKPYRTILFWVLVLGFITSAMKGISPEMIRMLQEAWEAKNWDRAWQIPLTIAILWTIASVGRYFHLYWMKYVSELVSVNLRRQLINKYLSLNLSFFHSFVSGSGGLISRMINDIIIIQAGLQKIADILREPFMAVIAFGYLLYLDWRLTFFIIIALPLITGVMRNLARSLRKYSRHNQEIMEDLTKTIKESLDGTRIVQSFNLEGEMRRRFEVQSERYLKTRAKIISREEAVGPVSETLAAITLAVILVYIGSQIFKGLLNVGDFIGFSFAIGLLQDSVKKLQSGYMSVQQASVALDRLHQILDTVSAVPDHGQPVPFPKDWQTIEFRNVTFAFDKEPILKNINLTIKRGEVIALVGGSGGGKSTLVNLLSRFFDPTSGEILIGGVSIKNFSLHELRSQIALVSQDVFLFADTIERNIHAGDFGKDVAGVEAAARLANAHTFINSGTKEGYQSRVGDMGSTLSGGEKQRVSIARAVFKDAPILVLDEATSALDSESEKEVQKGLDYLMKGRTAFVIAHRLSTISKADRILVMKKGEIVEQGHHQELLQKSGEYLKLFQLQSQF